MIYHLSLWMRDFHPIFNVVHYISTRAMAGLLTSLSLSLLLGPWFINLAGKLFRAKARMYTPETHQVKNGMPTMGGLFIVIPFGIIASG